MIKMKRVNNMDISILKVEKNQRQLYEVLPNRRSSSVQSIPEPITEDDDDIINYDEVNCYQGTN